jgi:hypothetical protein
MGHTHSAYARGLDALWGMYQWLDTHRRDTGSARISVYPTGSSGGVVTIAA